jgi:xylulokinase
METKYLVGVDFGTTGSRTIIYDLQGNEVGGAYAENKISFPTLGAYEYDGDTAINTLLDTTAKAIKSSGVAPEKIASVCFSAIRGCFALYDKNDRFVHPLILWPDTRGTPKVAWMRERLDAVGFTPEELYEKTAFPFFAGFASTRILWFRDAYPKKWERVTKIGSLQTVVQKAYGGYSNVDNAEDVGWFQQFDARTRKPISKMQQAWGIDPALFAEFVPSGTIVGKVSKEAAEKTGLAAGTPLVCGVGDQQCTIIGANCLNSGIISIYSGTCGVIVARTHNPTLDPARILNVCGAPGGEWQTEGTTTGMGGNYKWLRDALGQDEFREAQSKGKSVYDILNEKADASKPGSNGLVFLPYLSGADTPKMNRHARGAFLGLNHQHRKGDFIRAVIEGSVFELKTVMDVFKNTGIPIEKFRFSGGGARSRLWNQIVADVFNVSVTNVAASEATALGAAIIGGVGVGLFADVREASEAMVTETDTWEPIAKNVRLYAEQFELQQECYRAMTENGLFKLIAEREARL